MQKVKHLLTAAIVLACALLIGAVNFGDPCDPTTSHLNAYLTYIDAWWAYPLNLLTTRTFYRDVF